MAVNVKNQLLQLLQHAEQQMSALENGTESLDNVLIEVRQDLSKFYSFASRIRIKGLAQAGEKMNDFAAQPTLNSEELTLLAFTLSTLRRGIAEGSAEAVRSAVLETLELLGLEPIDASIAPEPAERSVKKPVESIRLERIVPPPPQVPMEAVENVMQENSQGLTEGARELERIAERLGGKIIPSESGGDKTIRLEFPESSLDRVKLLLSPYDLESSFGDRLPSQDAPRLKEVLSTVKDFMVSFAEGDFERAQQVLEELAGFQADDDLLKEIGGLARELHDSMKSFAATFDPALMELVEEKIPDSGNRLEHILQLTEEAANTTLDQAEAIRRRIERDQEKLAFLEKSLARLMPIGQVAHSRMGKSSELLKDLRHSFSNHQANLEVILTSQEYQDLTGQIINRIIRFQHDLENKLVNLVRTFGMKVKKDTEKKGTELYGPALEKSGAQTQDEIDSILAEFGF